MTLATSMRVSPLVDLPSELIESIIISATALGFPTAASVVGQTCRAMRGLVYEGVDQHLWRELFLAMFDDPRIVINADRAEQQRFFRLAGDEYVRKALDEARQELERTFDWGGEFRTRVWADKHVRAITRKPWTSGWTDPKATADAFETVMRTVATARPSLPVIVATVANTPPRGSEHEAHARGMPLSLLLALSYGMFPHKPNFYSVSRSTTQIDPSQAHRYAPSKNILWFDELVSNGLPPHLIKKLSGTSLYGGLQGVWDDREQSREMRAFCKLICCTGFIPIPQKGPNAESVSPVVGPIVSPDDMIEITAEHPICRVDDGPETSGVNGSYMSTSYHAQAVDAMDTTEAVDQMLPMDERYQRTRARRMARMRVYNLRYLNPDRHWGPFLLPPASDTKMNEPTAENFLQPILALFADHDAGHPNHHHEHDEDVDEDEDEDDDSEDEGGEESDHEGDDAPFEMLPLNLASPDAPLPTPAELFTDWAYLAAVRIVVEANLQDLPNPEELEGLLALDGLRRESAIQGITREDGTDPTSIEEATRLGRESALHRRDYECGWDWAGAAGSWRRCVCWLDYRDLIMQNFEKPDRAFTGPSLQEAKRIVPMNLRIEGFSPCPIPGYLHRPTIHLVGESAGSGTVRKMKGTVGIIADGSIRWHMQSLIDDHGTAEWVTEGVQLGEATSCMGVLGMWTGAQHDRMDPIGPFWMWKVG
ncbi:hypothetical protein BDW22DRAFT_1433579 [Trametopsis cervina]|nr:hypothetical protein BDW22DRAFT_1433579 [Trametopsis cervina]